MARLASALADRYAVERELGTGGMASQADRRAGPSRGVACAMLLRAGGQLLWLRCSSVLCAALADRYTIEHELGAKAKAGRHNVPRLVDVAKWLRGFAPRSQKVLQQRCRVKMAAVLATGVEPARALAQRGANPLRLPISPRQHLHRQRTLASPKAGTLDFAPVAEPRDSM